MGTLGGKKTFLNSMAVVERLLVDRLFCVSVFFSNPQSSQLLANLQPVQSEKRWKSLSQNCGSPNYICLRKFTFLKVEPQISKNRSMHSPPIHKGCCTVL